MIQRRETVAQGHAATVAAAAAVVAAVERLLSIGAVLLTGWLTLRCTMEDFDLILTFVGTYL
jgi:hypothetical protein